jgi:hypothetical protein
LWLKMEQKPIEGSIIPSEDHLDAMFVLMEQGSEENVLVNVEKEKSWICEWDNAHGDLTFFR